jgi:hypothetical protein
VRGGFLASTLSSLRLAGESEGFRVGSVIESSAPSGVSNKIESPRFEVFDLAGSASLANGGVRSRTSSCGAAVPAGLTGINGLRVYSCPSSSSSGISVTSPNVTRRSVRHLLEVGRHLGSYKFLSSLCELRFASLFYF